MQNNEDSERRIEIIEEELKSLEVETDNKDNIIGALKKYKKISKLNKIIIDEFIDRIYMGKVDEATKERDIIIEWRID